MLSPLFEMPGSVSSRVRIRPARSGDIEEMVSLLAILFSVEKDFEVRPARQRAGLRLLLKTPASLILVAESEGRVVGMVTLQVMVSTAEGGLTGLVEDLVIHEDFRRQGIGTMLMNSLVDRAVGQGVSRLQLLADRTNISAQAFYRSRGWSPTRMENWKRLLP